MAKRCGSKSRPCNGPRADWWKSTIGVNWFDQSSSGVVVPDEFQLFKFSVKYNDTDPAYLTTDPIDGATIPIGGKLISRTTIAPNGVGNANAAAGGFYIPSADGTTDRAAFHEIDGNILSIFPANDMQQASRLETISVSQQGCSCDPRAASYRYFFYSSVGTITVKNSAGTTTATLTAPTHSTDVIMYYDWAESSRTGIDTWLVARETANAVSVEKWTRSGTVVSIAETLWYKGIDGVCVSNIFNQVVNFDSSGATARMRFQDPDGKSGIFLSHIANSFVTEGLFEMPDGTYVTINPQGYLAHGGVTGGNTDDVKDPRGVRLKFNRSPSMDRYTKFKGGTLSGEFDMQVITADAGSPILTCVYDFGANTNQQNLSAWEAVVEDGATYTLRFRGSNSAPTTTPATHFLSTVPTYDANGANDGWGDTVPGAWQSTPTAHRYMQCEIVLSEAIPSSLITVQDILDAIPTLKILVLEGDEEALYITQDDSSRISLGVNQAVPANGFINTTASQRPIFNFTDDYTDDNANNNYLLLETPSEILSDIQGHLFIVGRREAITTRSIHLAASINNTNTFRVICGQKASTDTPANEWFMEFWDGSGLRDRVGFADATLAMMRADFICDGSVKRIRTGGVERVLNVSAGTNNGDWFAALTGANRLATGICLGTATVTGRHRRRLFGYASSVLTTPQSDLIDAYAAQENLLA